MSTRFVVDAMYGDGGDARLDHDGHQRHCSQRRRVFAVLVTARRAIATTNVHAAPLPCFALQV